MHALLRHLQFQPHGNRLLTSSAAFWLFSARILVFAMASAEMIAWGYLGFLFGDDPTRWVGAAFTATVIFIVVWMIDVSLITLDRAWTEHARTILGQNTSSRRRKLRELGTFGLRIALLVASLSVTAPYLAQVVFYRDIQQFITAEAMADLETGRKHISERYTAEVAAKENEASAKRTEYEREVAGKGASGRYGAGPAAQALLAGASKLDNEGKVLAEEKEVALREFDALAREWPKNRDKLAAEYNILLPRQSVLENRKALDALRQRPENRSTELAIKAFLAFIFSGLLLLKMFEPSSVHLYLSEVLQQEYGRYLAGTFDPVLPSTERSTTSRSAMSPQRFYDFLVRIWVPARRLEEQQADAGARTAAATQNLDLLENMGTRIDQEVEQFRNRVHQCRDQRDEASRSLDELYSAIATVTADLDFFRSKLVAVDSTRLDEEGKIQYRSHYNSKLAEADRALHEFKDAVPTETEKFRRAEEELRVQEAQFHEKESELADARQKIREVRNMLSDSVGARARSILTPVT